MACVSIVTFLVFRTVVVAYASIVASVVLGTVVSVTFVVLVVVVVTFIVETVPGVVE